MIITAAAKPSHRTTRLITGAQTYNNARINVGRELA